MPMEVCLEHISSNCNPIPGSFDFLTNDIIAYSYKNQIGLYSLISNTVYRNIHRTVDRKNTPNRVNCLKTLSTHESKYCIVVGYDDGFLVTFSSPDAQIWEQGQNIQQKNSILSFTVHENQFLAVLNNDALVTIYQIKNGITSEKSSHSEGIAWEELERIQFPLNKTIESVALQQIGQSLVIFLAGVDHKIHCYSLALAQKPPSTLEQEQASDKQQASYLFSLTGHENAITKVEVVKENEGSYLLASCSKDGYIRLWKITSNIGEAKFHKNVKELLSHYRVFLESVLISHECSVTNLHWARFGAEGQSLKLVSASMDCTVCIWSRNEEDGGSWSVDSRMGQFLGNKNAYFQAISNSSGSQLAALNFIGSVLIWNYDQQQNKFSLRNSFNGHYSKAKDIAWNHTGDYLVSVSKDQTTRVVARNVGGTGKYHEISRAQVHGYDINTLCLINVKGDAFDLIACGADQKVIRIVEPPACFANFHNSFTSHNLHLYFESPEEEKKYIQQQAANEKPLLYETYTEGGAQVLGLMTKATRVEKEKVVNYFDEEQEEDLELQDERYNPKELNKKTDFNIPPHDDYLVKHTLWPQMNKLYAHPHEIQYLCRSPNSKLMASSCTGLTKDASQIIVWDVETWKVHKVIPYHSYTVYNMEFTSKGNFLVSVSKDRKMAVFDVQNSFNLSYGYEAHSRAILCVSTSVDEKYIITGSRDKSIKLHSISEKKAIADFHFDHPVTAVAFGQLKGQQNIFCCGLSNGDVIFLRIEKENETFKICIAEKVSEEHSHTEKVNAIRWNGNRIATCSDDHSVCIFQVKL